MTDPNIPDPYAYYGDPDAAIDTGDLHGAAIAAYMKYQHLVGLLGADEDDLHEFRVRLSITLGEGRDPGPKSQREGTE